MSQIKMVDNYMDLCNQPIDVKQYLKDYIDRHDYPSKLFFHGTWEGLTIEEKNTLKLGLDLLTQCFPAGLGCSIRFFNPKTMPNPVKSIMNISSFIERYSGDEHG